MTFKRQRTSKKMTGRMKFLIQFQETKAAGDQVLQAYRVSFQNTSTTPKTFEYVRKSSLS